MHGFTRNLILAFALCALPVAVAGAQEEVTPEIISPDAPTAKRARAVAELLLAGDRKEIDSYFAANGTPEFIKGATYASDLTELLEILKTGSRIIVRMDGLGDSRVAAALGRDADSDPDRAIVVGMEPAAPHRITLLRFARIDGG